MADLKKFSSTGDVKDGSGDAKLQTCGTTVILEKMNYNFGTASHFLFYFIYFFILFITNILKWNLYICTIYKSNIQKYIFNFISRIEKIQNIIKFYYTYFILKFIFINKIQEIKKIKKMKCNSQDLNHCLLLKVKTNDQ